jgi:hypothetical protein
MLKKTINTNGITCLRQNGKIPFQSSHIFTWRTTKKMNLKLVLLKPTSMTSTHLVKLIPIQTRALTNDDKQTENGNPYAITSICPKMTKQVSKRH